MDEDFPLPCLITKGCTDRASWRPWWNLENQWISNQKQHFFHYVLWIEVRHGTLPSSFRAKFRSTAWRCIQLGNAIHEVYGHSKATWDTFTGGRGNLLSLDLPQKASKKVTFPTIFPSFPPSSGASHRSNRCQNGHLNPSSALGGLVLPGELGESVVVPF